MYEDLEQIANLKFGKELELISRETRETAERMANKYASSGTRSGQHEASIGRAQIDGAEKLVRALFQIWRDLIERRNGYISRADISFIMGKVDSYARTQKAHLHTAFSQQRMGAVVNVLTQESEGRMHAVTANSRLDLELMVREREAFPRKSSEQMHQLQADNLRKEGKPTRRTAEILNILIASPSDVSDERQVVVEAIHDWNASHASSLGIMLHPVRWESHAYPASGDRTQAIINSQIVESGDILIGIFGYRLGTPTGVAQSGTIEEIEEFRKARKYVALYFSTADVPRSADRKQLEALEAYKEERQKDTLYFEFRNPPELRDHLARHLPKIVHEVYQKVEPFNLIQGADAGLREQLDNTSSQQTQAATPNPGLLADLISELDDNLDCASRPKIGDVFRRPSTTVWLENRNKIGLPTEIYLQTKEVYNSIGRWADVVASSLHPNLGSMELNRIVSDLRSSIPELINELRKLQSREPLTSL